MTLYNRLSATYTYLASRVFSTYWQQRSPYVISTLDLKPTDHVLEIGAGVGPWTAFFAPKVASYTAFDLRYSSIKNVRNWKSVSSDSSPTATAKLAVMSATNMGFKDASFDKTFAIDVIEHIPDENAALREMRRVLKVGGYAVLTSLLQQRPGYIKRLEYPDHVREYTTEHFQQLFSNNGFKIENTFYFYYALSSIARELEVMSQSMLTAKIFLPATLAISTILRPLNDVERIAHIGIPGGIGILATAVDESQTRHS